MSSQPLVSIVTVVLNDAPNIEKTILSVLSQIDCNFEYILIDGGSNDGTLNTIDKYKDKFSCVISEKDQGIYYAMNKAISRANGKWLFFLNSGDVFFDKKTLSSFFSYESSDAFVLYGQHIIDYVGAVRKHTPKNLSHLWTGMLFSHQSVFVITALLKQYKFDTTYRLASDYDLISKLFNLRYKFQYVPRIVSVISANGVSDEQRLLVFSEYLKISKKYFPSKITKIYFSFKSLDARLRMLVKKILPLVWVRKIQQSSLF